MRYKRFVAFLIILATVVISPQKYYAAYFYDIAGHYAETAITSLASQGVITGRGNGYFAPGDLVTRAELVTMINRAYGFSKSANVYFSDVPANAWFHQQISYGVGAGFISGYEDNTIRPNNFVTRQEAAMMLANVTGRRYGSGEANYFYDASSISSYAKPAVDALYAAGIIGDDDGSRYFKPTVNITRADAAVWIFRVRGSNVGYIPPVTNYPSYEPYPTYYPSYSPYPTYYPYPTYRPNGTNVEVTSRTYGNRSGTTSVVTGNLTVVNKSTTVYNTRVYGDLIIDKNVGSGDVTLENVTIDGVAYIYGGGTDSIEFKDCDIKSMEVYRSNGIVRVIASNKTNIGSVDVRSSAVLEEDGLSRGGDGFTDVILLSSSKTIELEGSFNTVTLDANSSYLELNDGSIKRLNVDGKDSEVFLNNDTRVTNAYIKAACILTGRGKITKADITSNSVEAVSGIIESYASGSKRPSDYADDYEINDVVISNTKPSVGSNLTTTVKPSYAQAYVDYQWQRKYPTSSNWINISGETKSSYNVTSQDEGYSIRVIGYGRGNYSSSTVYSSATDVVTAAQSNTIDSVTIEGTPKVGNKLTAKVTPTTATVSYLWESGTTATNMTTIAGKTGSELDITESLNLAGKIIRVTVTGTGNYSGSKSAVTSAVAVADLQVSITYTGTSITKDTLLTATTTPANSASAFTWKVGNETPVTGNTYTVKAEDAGKSITVTATGSGIYLGQNPTSSAVTVQAAPATP